MLRPHGYILLVVLALTAALLTYSAALVRITVGAVQTERKIDFKAIALNIAEAGVEKAVWCMNQTTGTNCGGTYGSSYAGETNVSFGGGIYDIVVSAIDAVTKQIEVSGFYPNKTQTLGKTVIRTRVAAATDKASFNYGIQLGQGGFEMEENSTVNGSIYAHGTVRGDQGATITGDAYVATGAGLNPDQQDTSYDADFIFGNTNPQIDLAQSFIPSVTEFLNKISFYIKRTSGAPGSISVKIVSDNNNSPSTNVLASGTLSASLVSTSYGWVDIVFNNPAFLYSGTKYWIILDASQNSTKYWTIGSDAFDNYGNGTMWYSNDWDDEPWTASGRDINFKTWSGGITAEIKDITVNGNVYAYKANDVDVGGNITAPIVYRATVGGSLWASSTDQSTIGRYATSTDITNSTVGWNLWCKTKSATTVGWNTYCPYDFAQPAAPGPINMPISDGLIAGWKDDAAAGGTLTGNQTVSQNTMLGPKKINGNLTVGNGVTLTLTGSIYVTGDIIFDNNSETILDSAYSSTSGIIISDGNMTMNNGSIFSGTGAAGSYILLVSTKNDTLNAAVDVRNSNVSAILYAPYGIIDIHNNASLKEMSAWKIHANNRVTLNYESGLSEVLFSSGPSGGWSKLKGWWQIVE